MGRLSEALTEQPPPSGMFVFYFLFFISRLFPTCKRVEVRCHNNWTVLMEYCAKEETRVEGPFKFPLEHKLFNGKRGGDFRANPGSTFNEAVKELVQADDYELEWDSVLKRYNYMQCLVVNKREIFDTVKRAKTSELTKEIRARALASPLRIWQRKLTNFLTSDDARCNRRIWWFHESKGNIGKSFLCNHLQVVYNFIAIDKGKHADMVENIWTKYNPVSARRRSFIFDFCRDQKAGERSSWGAIPALIEKLSNDAPINRAKYTSDCMWFGPNKPVIVVFANSPPPLEVDDALFSQDRLDSSAFNIRSTVFCNRFSVDWRTDDQLESKTQEASQEGPVIID